MPETVFSSPERTIDVRSSASSERMAFAAEPIRHDPARALDEGIVRAVWLSPGELSADAARHRSPLVWRVVEDFLAGRRQSLDAVQQA